jgi:2-phosphosulfolactate phosphatase
MTKISLDFTYQHIKSALDLKDKNVVFIDVLRTSSSMIAGLAHGAKEILPAEDVATAGLMGRNSQGHSLLCGERNGKIIDGFNLGNSVKEYTTEKVNNKTLIFSTSNGTPALMMAKFSRNCVITAFSNIRRVVRYLRDLNEDFIVLCAGRSGEFSLEDTVCAGMLISLLIGKKKKEKYILTDSALGSTKLYNSYKRSLISVMRDSEHGKFLSGIGFEDDLSACSKVDTCDCLPILRNGVIKLIESFDSDPKLSMRKIANKSINS